MTAVCGEFHIYLSSELLGVASRAEQTIPILQLGTTLLSSAYKALDTSIGDTALYSDLEFYPSSCWVVTIKIGERRRDRTAVRKSNCSSDNFIFLVQEKQ